MTEVVSLVKFLHAHHFSVMEALVEISFTFPEKPISKSTIYCWYKKISYGICKAPRKVWQKRRRLPFVDELLEVVKKNPYCRSRNLAKFLNCSKMAFLGDKQNRCTRKSSQRGCHTTCRLSELNFEVLPHPPFYLGPCSIFLRTKCLMISRR